jgi:hypothetical protein
MFERNFPWSLELPPELQQSSTIEVAGAQFGAQRLSKIVSL